MITAFFTKIRKQLEPAIFNSYLDLLSEEEQLKINKFRNWQDAHLSLFGKLLLVNGLVRFGYNGLSIRDIKLTYYSRPFLKNGPEFNISHAGKYVICVLADEVVGVDIEEVKSIDINDFRSQWNEEEWSNIVDNPNPLHQFYRYWTRKEAVIKADGRGMHLPLQQVNVTQSPVTVEKLTWFLTEIDVDTKYYCCIATPKKPYGQVSKRYLNFT